MVARIDLLVADAQKTNGREWSWGTHFRPLVGRHRFGGDGVVQLPPTSPAVCCTVAAGAGAPNWLAAKSAAWSAIPLSL